MSVAERVESIYEAMQHIRYGRYERVAEAVKLLKKYHSVVGEERTNRLFVAYDVLSGATERYDEFYKEFHNVCTKYIEVYNIKR